MAVNRDEFAFVCSARQKYGFKQAITWVLGKHKK